MKRQFHQYLLTIISLWLLNGVAQAEETFGWIEKAKIKPWDIEVKAKLDSGALTSSIHAEAIESFERGGEEWVRFTIEVEDEDSDEQVSERVERPLFRHLTVSGAGGEDSRPVVLMKICMGERIYEEQFSLADRDDMLYPLLLGRRTIQHLGEIDITKTFLHEPVCDDDAPVVGYNEQADDEDIGID